MKKFQMTIYDQDEENLKLVGDALEASGINVNGPDGTRSKAAIMRYVLSEAALRAKENARTAKTVNTLSKLRESIEAHDP